MSELFRDSIKSVHLDKYTIGGVSVRGLLTVKLADGTVLNVTSPSEEGEPIGAGSYGYQSEVGKTLARLHGAVYGERDLDLIDRFIKARSDKKSHTPTC